MTRPARPTKTSRPATFQPEGVMAPSPLEDSSSKPMALPGLPLDEVIDASLFQTPEKLLKKQKELSPSKQEDQLRKQADAAVHLIQSFQILGWAFQHHLDKGLSVSDKPESIAAYFEQVIHQANAWAQHERCVKVLGHHAEPIVQRLFLLYPHLASPGMIESLWGLAGKTNQWIKTQVSPWKGLAAELPIAAMEVTAELSLCVNAWPLHRVSVEEDVAWAVARIIEVAQESMAEVVPQASSEAARGQVFLALVQQLTKLLSKLWIAHGEQHQQKWEKWTDAARQQWKRANPEGLSLVDVETQFRQHAARMVKMARLAKPR